jgi:hypothetical protein
MSSAICFRFHDPADKEIAAELPDEQFAQQISSDFERRPQIE